MKIYFNRKPVEGPWGGGNKILSSLVKKTIEDGNEPVFNLCSEIDAIFCMDPRPNNFGVHYGHLLEYRKRFGAKIIQRVGDVGTHGKPDLTSLVRETVGHSDFVIFPSEYARVVSCYSGENFKIIPNRPMSVFFESRRDSSVINSGQVKLVTHHWSTNPKKGFSTYTKIADAIPENVVFTYIGRFPSNFSHDRIKTIDPLCAEDLAKEIPKHDVYVTASQQEAGANHVLEAMAAGLPVLFCKGGGSIPEYVSSRGLEFHDIDSFILSLNTLVSSYESYHEKCMRYDETINDTTIEIYEQICNIT